MRFPPANRTTTAVLSSLALFRSLSFPCCPIQQQQLNLSTMRGAVISIAHGGGPLPLLGDPSHKEITKSLKERVPKVLGIGSDKPPRAIIVVTAHWSEAHPTISNGKTHSLYYDYGGFPPETYKLKYDAPGSPEIAQEVFGAMKAAGMDPKLDSSRGWDHGVFVPLLLINPTADIPILQLSVLSSDSPSQHYALGRALAPLRDSGIAIIGSGSASFHNLRLMFTGNMNDKGFRDRNVQFNKAVDDAVNTPDPDERAAKFDAWREWPGAKEAHPAGGVEHFLPLIVCAGAAGEGKSESYGDDMMGMINTSYYWQ